MAQDIDMEAQPIASCSTAGPNFQLTSTLRGHKRAVSGVAFSPTSDRLLASCSADCTLAIWDLGTGEQATHPRPMAHPQGVNAVAWNPQGNYLASVSDDMSVKLWDAESGMCLRTMTGHTNYVFCCQFDPVGHILVGEGAACN